MNMTSDRIIDAADKTIRHNVKKRLDALSDSTILKMYHATSCAPGLNTQQQRSALISMEISNAKQTTTYRQKLGLTLDQMALMLGYTGKNRRAMMHDIESGRKEFRPAQMRLMDAYLSGYRPKDWPE